MKTQKIIDDIFGRFSETMQQEYARKWDGEEGAAFFYLEHKAGQEIKQRLRLAFDEYRYEIKNYENLMNKIFAKLDSYVPTAITQNQKLHNTFPGKK